MIFFSKFIQFYAFKPQIHFFLHKDISCIPFIFVVKFLLMLFSAEWCSSHFPLSWNYHFSFCFAHWIRCFFSCHSSYAPLFLLSDILRLLSTVFFSFRHSLFPFTSLHSTFTKSIFFDWKIVYFWWFPGWMYSFLSLILLCCLTTHFEAIHLIELWTILLLSYFCPWKC